MTTNHHLNRGETFLRSVNLVLELEKDRIETSAELPSPAADALCRFAQSLLRP